MEPLSQNTRRIYLALLIVLFIILVPITVLYSAGYRLGEGFTLVKTGGVFVGVDESNATLILDGKPVRSASILKSGFFIQDLTPRVYHIVVEKEGFRSWEKILEVKPQRVVEAAGFILPVEIPYIEVAPTEDRYERVLDLFATSSPNMLREAEYPTSLSTSTRSGVSDVKRKGDVVLWREGESVYARWANTNSKAPSYFCEDGVCEKEISINKKQVDYYDFHPLSNELILIITDGVVSMTEIDPRIPRNTQTMFNALGVQVRTEGDSIFILEPTAEGIQIFEYEL